LDSLRVRDITRRRGVGQYLIEEVIRENSDVSSWWMADVGVEDRSVMAAFMQALGFTAQENGWEKDKKPDGADAYPAYMLGEKIKNHLAIFQEFRAAGRRQVMKSPGAYRSK
jgi:GNAT superfamily N-acetyltransferase